MIIVPLDRGGLRSAVSQTMSAHTPDVRPRSGTGRGQRSAPSSGRLSALSGTRGTSTDDVPLMPVMPAFFPDPIALDAEDVHLKVYCEELLTKEYDTAVEMLYPRAQLMQERLAKRSEKSVDGTTSSIPRGTNVEPSPETVCNTVQESERATSADVFRVGSAPQPDTTRTVASAKRRRLRSIDTDDRKGGAPSPEGVIFFKSSEAVDERGAADQGLHGTGACELSLTHASHAEGGTTSVGRNLRAGWELADSQEGRPPVSLLTVPKVEFSASHSVEVIENAEKIGLANATRGARVAAVKITKLQQQNDFKLIVPVKFLPSPTTTVATPATSTPATTSPRTARMRAPSVQSLLSKSVGSHQNCSEAQASETSQPCPEVSMADVLVLEATERLAAEMHCEAICCDIINAAAEMYVSRFFDTIANAYTALSTWDELHTTLAQSFIPERPHEPIKLETEIAESLAIRRDNAREGKGSKPECQQSCQGVVDVANDFLVEANECSTYLGMLPIWARCPSLLDSNAILSFHQSTGEIASSHNAQFDFGIDSKAQRNSSHVANSTFARFLSSLDRNVSEVLMSESTIGDSLATAQHTAEVKPHCSSVLALDEGDGGSPGTPPRMVPIDDYARYVVPPLSTPRVDQQETDKGKLLSERQHNRKKGRSLSASGDPYGLLASKGSAVHTADGSRRGRSVINPAAIDSPVFHRSEGRQLTPTVEKLSRGKLTSKGCSGSVLSSLRDDAMTQANYDEDDWGRAMRQITHGGLNTGFTSTSGNQPYHMAETLLYIEDGDVSTVAVGARPGRRCGKDNEGTTGRNGKPASRPKTSEAPPPPENIFVGGRNEKLRVGITEEGRVSFQVSHDEDESGDAEQKDLQTQSQSSKTEISVRGRRSLIFLSRKQRRDLEERQRRRKEAAERAAYESMFYTTPKPSTPDSVLEESGQQSPHHEEGKQTKVVAEVVPEPGVVVEKWINPQENAKGKAPSGSKGQWRNEVAPVVSGYKRPNLLADGGDWVTPEGRYHWNNFAGVGAEKGREGRVTSAMMQGAGPKHGGATREGVARPSSGQQHANVSGVAFSEDGRKSQAYLPKNQKGPGQHAVARSFKWEPPTVIFSNQEEEKKKAEGEHAGDGRDPFRLLGLKRIAMGDGRAGKGLPRRPVLPRLPSIPEVEDFSPRRRLHRKPTSKSFGSQEIRALASLVKSK